MKTTEMVGDGNTRKAETTRVSQCRIPDYKNVLKFSFKTGGMNATCLCLRSRSWYSFTDPGGMEGQVALGWLVDYIPK